jgi:hypothetical protein
VVAHAVKDAEQRRRFERAILANELIVALLERMASSDLPEWYLSGGCLFQTVWNIEHGFDASAGILDYDLFYFDGADLSAQAEHVVRRSFLGSSQTCRLRWKPETKRACTSGTSRNSGHRVARSGDARMGSMDFLRSVVASACANRPVSASSIHLTASAIYSAWSCNPT